MKLTPFQNSLSYTETKSETMKQGEDSYTTPYNATFKHKYKNVLFLTRSSITSCAIGF